MLRWRPRDGRMTINKTNIFSTFIEELKQELVTKSNQSESNNVTTTNVKTEDIVAKLLIFMKNKIEARTSVNINQR